MAIKVCRHLLSIWVTHRTLSNSKYPGSTQTIKATINLKIKALFKRIWQTNNPNHNFLHKIWFESSESAQVRVYHNQSRKPYSNLLSVRLKQLLQRSSVLINKSLRAMKWVNKTESTYFYLKRCPYKKCSQVTITHLILEGSWLKKIMIMHIKRLSIIISSDIIFRSNTVIILMMAKLITCNQYPVTLQTKNYLFTLILSLEWKPRKIIF